MGVPSEMWLFLSKECQNNKKTESRGVTDSNHQSKNLLIDSLYIVGGLNIHDYEEAPCNATGNVVMIITGKVRYIFMPALKEM